MELDYSNPKDQGIIQFIRASRISLSKQQVRQFIVPQNIDPEIQKMALQPKSQLERQKILLFPQGILDRTEHIDKQTLVPQSLNQNIIGRIPRCPSYWTRGSVADCGIHRTGFLVPGLMGRCRKIRAILSGLPLHEIRPQEKDDLV